MAALKVENPCAETKISVVARIKLWVQLSVIDRRFCDTKHCVISRDLHRSMDRELYQQGGDEDLHGKENMYSGYDVDICLKPQRDTAEEGKSRKITGVFAAWI